MSSNPRDLALELAVVTLVADMATEYKDNLRSTIATTLDDAGADSTRAEVDGERIAKVALVQPKARAVVSDEEALTRHVATSRPDEVIQRVRESYRKALLDSLVEGPDGQAVDPSTGEVVPGVAFRMGSPYISTRFEKTGRDILADAIRNGTVTYNLQATINNQIESGATQ
jgi:hypothetical protein